MYVAGKASPEKCSSTSSDESVGRGENGVGGGEAMSSIRLSSSDGSAVIKDEDESADEFQDEIHFDPTISSGHLGFRDVRVFIIVQFSFFKYLSTYLKGQILINHYIP